MEQRDVFHARQGGFYQDEVGSRQCKQCKNGSFVRQSASKSAENCEVCPEGTDLNSFAGHRACFCKINYARTHRFKGCTICFEEGLNCSQDSKSIRPGYYWNWTFEYANITEYSNFVSLLQKDSAEYDKSNLYYKHRIPKVYQCPRGDSCANKDSFTAKNIQGHCEKGYRGWLCSLCETKYYSSLNMCIPCPSQVWIVLDIIAVLCFALALYILISRQIKIDKKQSSGQRSLVDKLSSQMKIVLGYYQVVGELCESFYIVNWVGPLQIVGKVMSFLKLNLLRVFIRPHCYSENFRIDVKSQFLICLIFPFILSALLVCCYFVWKLHLKYKFRYQTELQYLTLSKVKDRLLTYALFLLFITYPPTCDVIFKLYPGACKTFYIYENDTSINITLLRADLDVDCNSLQNYQLLAYIATVSYILAFPCTLFFLLRRNCKKSCKPTNGVDDETLCSPESQYYRLPNDTTCLVHHQPVYSGIPVWLKFLCENYKPQYWYWEIVELARKVAQTVLVTLLGWEDAMTKLLTISTSVLFLTLHGKLAPMTYNFEQRLQVSV
ncbi:hypothetical protein HOLleu_02153 [Holothuria leucospilota]|uniref:Uncharacterized protein n=1 Tax=Holothuria leucospilota TaxID=206669 RepID=A0A9Q1HL70_HOLLE|nr:hypothetical protein HOLleu_02153 [Holothuria leucospilota]